MHELAERLGGALRGAGDVQISGINSIHEAGPAEITFAADAAHAKALEQSKAGAVVISEEVAMTVSGGSKPLIIVPDAEFASILLLQIFETAPPQPDAGVHPSAAVHPSVKIGKDARIGPHVSVDGGSILGNRTILHAGARIGPNVVIGDDTVVHSNTVIRHNCRVGNRVILHQNASIGADGFGYRPAPNKVGLIKIPHIGDVVIEDDVEIGANTCVDRGKFGSTVIGAGTKIDNLVQIGHNCRIGRSCVIAGLVGISGSVVIGDGVQIGGQVGISEHVKVGSGARIGAKTGVISDLDGGVDYLGLPAVPAKEALRMAAAQRKLPDLIRRLSRSRESGPGNESGAKSVED